jgi:hypothetical protein
MEEAFASVVRQSIKLVEDAGYKVLTNQEYLDLKGWSELRDLEEESWDEETIRIRAEKGDVHDWVEGS